MNKEIINNVITRLPPSPTGLLHIGTTRTALFNYLFTKQNNGKMLFRLEDTDRERSKEEFEKNIIEGLKWLGLDYDGEISRQSEKTELYEKYLEKMIKDGFAYEAEENKDGDKKVIRFKNPNKEIIFQDLVRGEIKFDTTELGDFVIAKSLSDPLYHLAVVVDDFESEVSHVIRGEDGISNTPRQILIQEAIGAKRPIYAHLPLILAPDKSKMSKRFGAISIDEYKEKGYLQEAIINYLALLGWSPEDEQEIFSLEELIEKFDIKKVHKSGAVFNIEKLNWINKEYIKLMTEADFKIKVLEFLPKEFGNKIKENDKLFNKILPIIKERIEKFEDVIIMLEEGDLDYYFEQPEYELEKIFWKDENDLNLLKTRIEKSIQLIESVKEFSAEKIKESIWDYASEKGRGSILWPIRYALSGKDKSPDPFLLSEVLGQEETIKRLTYVIEKINSTKK
ncbi:MAG: glutamate--tRNA ligase [Candidatus Pacebacteria bacterium]|nr:glutamate--tRNA ligase [Candidatus Paceibacterota bacterium]